MEAAITIILLGLVVFLGFKFITMKPKGSHAEMEVRGGNPPTNNSGINVQNIAHSTINISVPEPQVVEKTEMVWKWQQRTLKNYRRKFLSLCVIGTINKMAVIIGAKRLWKV